MRAGKKVEVRSGEEKVEGRTEVEERGNGVGLRKRGGGEKELEKAGEGEKRKGGEAGTGRGKSGERRKVKERENIRKPS